MIFPLQNSGWFVPLIKFIKMFYNFPSVRIFAATFSWYCGEGL